MDREMNFWDLCVAVGRAIGRLFVACWSVVARMIRLTWRYWWLVIPIVALAIAGAVYHTRPANIRFRVNAIALLKGPSLQQFEQAYTPIKSACLLPEGAPIAQYIYNGQARRFTSYRVIDALNDGKADYIDFKRKSSPTDTVKVQMHDRVCLQFRVQGYCIPKIPEMEKGILETLNSNPVLQQAYEAYVKNLKEEVAFNHRQTVKLDSLTSCYYFNNPAIGMDPKVERTGVAFYGDRRIRLFLDEIYKQQAHTQSADQRLQLATAPVVLEDHFAVDPMPVMTRQKCTLIFFLLGWIGACILAEVIDKRKTIYAWLKE